MKSPLKIHSTLHLYVWPILVVVQNVMVNVNHHRIFDSSENKKISISSHFLKINKAFLMTGIDQHGSRKGLTVRVTTSPVTRGDMVMKSSQAIISSALGFSVWSMDQYDLMSMITLSLPNASDLSERNNQHRGVRVTSSPDSNVTTQSSGAS